MRLLSVILLAVPVIFCLATPAAGSWQVRADWGLEEENLILSSAGVQWWSGGRWGLRGACNFAGKTYSGGLLYRTREGLWINPYAGVGLRDLFGASGIAYKYRVEVIAGLELELGRFFPGLSTACEVRLAPAALTRPVGEQEDKSLLLPHLGVSLLYRFGGQVPVDEFALLARLIAAEAGGEPYEGQVAVGAVVMNRVKSPEFPNTIRGVIYQRGQFSSVPMLRGTQPSQSALTAAREALDGQDPSGGALYFYNPSLSSSEGLRFFATSGLRVTVRIGNHIFLK